MTDTPKLMKLHRGMMWSAAARLLIDGLFSRVADLEGAWITLYWVLFVLLGLLLATFVFTLTNRLHGFVPAALSCGFSFTPCAGFLVVLLLHGQATDQFRKRGFAVGFVGASNDQIIDAENVDLPENVHSFEQNPQ